MFLWQQLAHKTILAARSEVLRKMVENFENGHLMIFLKEDIPEPDDRNDWTLQSGDYYNRCYVLIGCRSNA